MIRVVVALVALAAMVQSANAYYPSWWRGKLPACSSPEVLAQVQERIAYGAPSVLGYHLAIKSFDGIDEDAVKAHGKSLIDRRFCTATAWLSNGQQSEVVYLIEATQGFASIGWSVQSCLPGYDPWRIYDGWCRSIRP